MQLTLKIKILNGEQYFLSDKYVWYVETCFYRFWLCEHLFSHVSEYDVCSKRYVSQIVWCQTDLSVFRICICNRMCFALSLKLRFIWKKLQVLKKVFKVVLFLKPMNVVLSTIMASILINFAYKKCLHFSTTFAENFTILYLLWF